MSRRKIFEEGSGEDPPVETPPPPPPPVEAAPAAPVIMKGGNRPGKVPPSLRGTSQDPSRKQGG